MFCRLSQSRRFLVAALWLASLNFVLHAQDGSHRGRKYKAPPPTSHVEVTVIRASNGKPVENASVIFHPLVDGKDNGNMQLKTNDEGKAVLDLLEMGSNVRLQIIKSGFQTYGEDYKIDKDHLTIEVKLNRPVEQYSTYKHAADGSNKTAPAPESKPKDSPSGEVEEKQKDAPKDTPKDESTPPQPK